MLQKWRITIKKIRNIYVKLQGGGTTLSQSDGLSKHISCFLNIFTQSTGNMSNVVFHIVGAISSKAPFLLVLSLAWETQNKPWSEDLSNLLRDRQALPAFLLLADSREQVSKISKARLGDQKFIINVHCMSTSVCHSVYHQPGAPLYDY